MKEIHLKIEISLEIPSKKKNKKKINDSQSIEVSKKPIKI